MAKRRRVGMGMTPLFDVQAFDRPTAPDPPARGSRMTGSEPPPPPATPIPVSYKVRGVFRWGDGAERTRTVEGHSLRHRLDADIRLLADHLMRDGWQFPEGRAVMVEFLGVWADDGTQILVSGSTSVPVA
jgi:hypothetical protein